VEELETKGKKNHVGFEWFMIVGAGLCVGFWCYVVNDIGVICEVGWESTLYTM